MPEARHRRSRAVFEGDSDGALLDLRLDPPPEGETVRLVTVHEFAAQLGVSENALYRWVNQRKISFYRLPSGQVRFPIDEILEEFRHDPDEETAA